MAFLKYVGPEPEVLDPFLGTFVRGIVREIENEAARLKVQGNSAVWQILQPAVEQEKKTVKNRMMDYEKKDGE